MNEDVEEGHNERLATREGPGVPGNLGYRSPDTYCSRHPAASDPFAYNLQKTRFVHSERLARMNEDVEQGHNERLATREGRGSGRGGREAHDTLGYRRGWGQHRALLTPTSRPLGTTCNLQATLKPLWRRRSDTTYPCVSVLAAFPRCGNRCLLQLPVLLLASVGCGILRGSGRGTSTLTKTMQARNK